MEWISKIEEGATANVWHLAVSVHTGTHIDVPYHFLVEGDTLEEIPLKIFIGRAYVGHLPDTNLITADVLENAPGIQASVNGVESWYDNAPMESSFATLKSERVHHCIYQTREDARTDLFFYIEARYNPRRLHSAPGYLSPEAFEQAYHQQQGNVS